MGDNDADGKPSDKPALNDGAWGGKAGGNREVVKKEGPKGEKAWGNRRPEPEDPSAPKKGPAQEISVGPVYSWKSNVDHAYGETDKSAIDPDKTFVQTLKVTASDIEVGSASVKLNEGKAKLVGAKFGVTASAVHGEVDLVKVIGAWLFGKPKAPPGSEPPAPPGVSFAPMAARLGDLTTHGSPLMPGPGSPNVMIGGMPAWRVGLDLDLCPFPGAAPHGVGPTAVGEPTVFINGAPAARMGDYVLESTGGPNVIVTGCETVMIGSPAGPPPDPKPVPSKPADKPWVVFAANADADMVTGEAKGDFSAEMDLKKGRGKVEVAAGAEVAVFKAKVPLKVTVRIPWTEYSLGVGMTAEVSALSLGAEAGGGVAINEDGKLFSGTWGAKVGAGLAGAGLKFGIDISK